MTQAAKITVNASIQAPLTTVWNAWNNPEDIIRWNAADPSWHCPSSENDLKVGGCFKNRMEAKDGSIGFDFSGTYDCVIPHQEIAYTMDDGRKASTLFREENGKTIVSTTFDAENVNDIEMQQQGWQAILNNFVRHVEKKEL